MGCLHDWYTSSNLQLVLHRENRIAAFPLSLKHAVALQDSCHTSPSSPPPPSEIDHHTASSDAAHTRRAPPCPEFLQNQS